MQSELELKRAMADLVRQRHDEEMAQEMADEGDGWRAAYRLLYIAEACAVHLQAAGRHEAALELWQVLARGANSGRQRWRMRGGQT